MHFFEESHTNLLAASVTMKTLLIISLFAVASVCNGDGYGSPNVYQFLAPARLNLGFNAGLRLPQLPSLSFTEQDIPLPVPDLANVEIPFVFPTFTIPRQRIQVNKGY